MILQETARAQERELKGTSREVDRDLASLDRDMEAEIRQAGRRGDEAGARIMARQLIKMRNQRQRLLQVKGQSAASQMAMGQVMAKTTSAIATMNKQVNVSSMQRLSNRYEVESAKMEMTTEMMDETYDSIFEGNEEEESSIMDQIYDEIGLEYSSAATLPTTAKEISSTEISDKEVDAFIRDAIKQ